MKAFLLAAGLGTRLKPFTDKHPKALATVNGTTLLEWNIRKLQQFGIHEFVVNIHYLGQQIVDFLKENNGFGSRYHISDESSELLETGGALWKAQNFFERADNILMMNVDILSNIDLKALIHFHLLNNPLATLAIQNRESSRKLIFHKKDQGDLILKGWKNTVDQSTKPSNLILTQNDQEMAFSGIQIISSDIFKKIDKKGKFSIIDTYLELCNDESILGFDHSGDIMIDVGKPESLLEAEKIFQ